MGQVEMRNAMLATSAQLARLLLRMNRLSHSARHNDDGTIVSAENAKWTVGDLDPASPLLEGMRGKPLVVATMRLLEIHTRLLAAYASNDEIDPRWVCRVLLALGDEFAEQYPPAVTRMASIAGIQLPEEPRDLHNGLGLREFTRPGEWRMPEWHTSK
jgi:hypothetical protein